MRTDASFYFYFTKKSSSFTLEVALPPFDSLLLYFLSGTVCLGGLLGFYQTFGGEKPLPKLVEDESELLKVLKPYTVYILGVLKLALSSACHLL